MNEYKFKVGDKVDRINSDYKFPGTIVSIFKTTSGVIRIVVEMDKYKLLHIMNEQQLVLKNNKK